MVRKKLFISYSRKDVRWLDRVREHLTVLEREGLIDPFDDTQIGAGEDWYARLDREMLEARIALLLISASFLTSAFIRKEEIPRLFNKHKTGGMVLYPLLVRDCAWQEVSWLSSLQIRPTDARPIAPMRSAVRDKCLADVAREIASIVRADPRRQLHHEGEVRMETYFRRAWPELSRNLTTHLDITTTWVREVQTGRERAGYFTVSTLPHVALDGDLRIYDKNFTRAFDEYMLCSQKLYEQVKAFNDLADPSTWVFRVGSLFAETGIGKVDEETIERRRRAEEIVRKYLGPGEDFTNSDISTNPRYREDLAQHEQQVVAAAEQLQVANEQLARFVELFSPRFA